jgi:emfourin
VLVGLASAAGCGKQVGTPPTGQVAASPTEVDEVMTQRIQVEVTRTGGFGGLVTSRSADTDALPAEDARRLSELVGELDPQALRDQPGGTRALPDAFEYDVSISRAGEHVRLRVRDPDVPAELRPLIQFVLQRT